MKIKRFFLVLLIVIIFITCMSIMNKRFDRLSRYPYEDAYARERINSIMTDEEIEFLIEYSIDPAYFIEYIECKDFNVFHVDSYNIAKEYCWYLSNENIVELVELIYKYKSEEVNEVLGLLQYYNFEEIKYFLVNGDKYAEATELYTFPDDLHIVLNNDVFIGNHIPYDLISNESYTLKNVAYNNFEKVLKEINKRFDCEDYGGIKFLDSYISYDKLEELHKHNKLIIPGHNEHQTGLCIDIDLNDSIFNENAKYVELKSIFEEYGFKITECELSKYHLRYNGEYASK